MKNLIIYLSLIATGIAQTVVVHDPLQTAQTIAEYQKQLDEWTKQHESMESLTEISKEIAEYNEELNSIIGTTEEALIKANTYNVLSSLENLSSMGHPKDLESEIIKISDMLEMNKIIKKSKIYGDINLSEATLKISDPTPYKRYALIIKQGEEYLREREIVVREQDLLKVDLLNAEARLTEASTLQDVLLIQTELTALNAKLNLLILRLDTSVGDLQVQLGQNQNRETLEQQAKIDKENLDSILNLTEKNKKLQQSISASSKYRDRIHSRK